MLLCRPLLKMPAQTIVDAPKKTIVSGSKKPSNKSQKKSTNKGSKKDVEFCQHGRKCKFLKQTGECQLRHDKDDLIEIRRDMVCPHDANCTPRHGQKCLFGYHPKKDFMARLRGSSSAEVEEVKETKLGVEEKSNPTNSGSSASSAAVKETLFRDTRLRLLKESMNEFVSRQAALEREQSELRQLSLKIQRLMSELENNTD